MSIKLIPVEGLECEPLFLDETAAGTIFGREASCGIVLKDKKISRTHCSIKFQEGTWYVTDLDSKTGVYVDTIQIEKQFPCSIHSGDLLSIGPLRFLVEITPRDSYDPTLLQFDSSDSMATNATLLAALHDASSTEKMLAWESFVSLYEPVIQKVARKFGCLEQDLEDVTQQVHMIFVDGGKFSFDKAKGKFRSYLKTVTIHEVIQFWRKTPRELTGIEKEDEAVNSAEVEFEQRYREKLLQFALVSVQRNVDPIQYEAFELYGRRGMPAQQVALKLEKSIDFVRQAKSRVMKLVRSEIARLDDAK